MSKKRLSVSLLIIIVIAGVGVYVYLNSRVTASELSRKYVENIVASKGITDSEKYSGTDTVITDRGALDTTTKNFHQTAELSCKTTVEDKVISVKVSLQQDNAKTYLRYDSATGEIRNVDTNKVIDVASAYSKAIGTWYKTGDEDPAIKSELDSGVYVFNSAVIAPSYDKQKVADALINKGAFTFGDLHKDGSNYSLAFTSHKNAYLEALKQAFPNLSKPDLIIDGIFGDKSTLESTLTLTKDGKLVSEKLSQKNLCVSIIEKGFATTHSTIPQDVTGVSTPQKAGSIKITPITNSKPIADLAGEIVY